MIDHEKLQKKDESGLMRLGQSLLSSLWRGNSCSAKVENAFGADID